jgi:hypothetical protein
MSGTQRAQAYFLGTAFPNGLPNNSITQTPLQDLIVTVVGTGAIMTSGSSITMSTNYLKINKTSGSATAVTLPTVAVPWINEYTIKDGKGDCATNPITLTPSSGLIDGASTFVMNINSLSVTLVFDGTNWSII